VDGVEPVPNPYTSMRRDITQRALPRAPTTSVRIAISCCFGTPITISSHA